LSENGRCERKGECTNTTRTIPVALQRELCLNDEKCETENNNTKRKTEEKRVLAGVCALVDLECERKRGKKKGPYRFLILETNREREDTLGHCAQRSLTSCTATRNENEERWRKRKETVIKLRCRRKRQSRGKEQKQFTAAFFLCMCVILLPSALLAHMSDRVRGG
jgi:hypothetical protein